MNEAELIAAVQRARVAMTAQYATLRQAIGTDIQDHETGEAMTISELQAIIAQDLATLRDAQDAEERALLAVNPLRVRREAANTRWNHDVMELGRLMGPDALHEWLGTITRIDAA